jgi:hypothetical protein
MGSEHIQHVPRPGRSGGMSFSFYEDLPGNQGMDRAMTAKQRMEKRMQDDEKMIARINRIIDKSRDRTYNYPEAVGAITAILEMAGRRREAGDNPE